MMRQARLIGLWLSVACLVGCASGGGPTGTGLLVEPGEARQLGYGILWTLDLRVPRGQALSACILDDMLVAIESGSNIVTAVSLKDGKRLWATSVGEPTQPLIAALKQGNKLYVNSDTRLFTLEADTGVLKLVQNLDFPVSTGPVLFEDFAIFGGSNGQVFAHDLSTGYKKWTYQVNGAVNVRPILVGTSVVVADNTGVLTMLVARNGDPVWKVRTFGPIVAQPTASNLGVFAASLDQHLYAINRSTHQDRWVFRTPVPLRRDPLLVGNLVLQPVGNTELVAIDGASPNGAELWRAPTGGAPIGLIDGGLLVNEGTRLVVLDPQTGKTANQITTRRVRNVFILANKSLLLVSPLGRILRLDPQM